MDARVKPAHDEALFIAPAVQRTTPQGRRAALRPGNGKEIGMGRVVVAGSINMDVVALADRHPRLGETVAGRAINYFPGGKGANQAVAAIKLGAATMLIGRVGTDVFGRELRAFLSTQGVDLTFVKDTAEIHSGTALITLANA